MRWGFGAIYDLSVLCINLVEGDDITGAFLDYIQSIASSRGSQKFC